MGQPQQSQKQDLLKTSFPAISRRYFTLHLLSNEMVSQSLRFLFMHKSLQNYQGHFPLSFGHAYNFPSKRQILSYKCSRTLMLLQKEWYRIFLTHPAFTKVHQFQFFRLKLTTSYFFPGLFQFTENII